MKVMTGDPGARFLAEVADDLKAQLDALKARVDDCCDGRPAPSHRQGCQGRWPLGQQTRRCASQRIPLGIASVFGGEPMRKLAIASLVLLGCYKRQPNVTIVCDGSPANSRKILQGNRMQPMRLT